MKNFKVILTEIPEVWVPTGPGPSQGEKKRLGKFSLGRTYRVYEICDAEDYTDFLVADDLGKFFWINMSAFNEK